MQLRIDKSRTFVDEFTHKGVLVQTAEWEGPMAKVTRPISRGGNLPRSLAALSKRVAKPPKHR
jgi:hypothetical protein